MQTPPKSLKNRFATLQRNYSKFPNLLIRSTELNSLQKTILLYIASYSECYSSHDAMAKVCGVSSSSIGRALRSLKSRSMVDWQFRFGTSNIYTIPHKDEWKITPALNPKNVQTSVSVTDPTSVSVTDGVSQMEGKPQSQGPTIKELLRKEPFKVGDMVVCIDAEGTRLTRGQAYLVTEVHHRGALINLDGVSNSMAANSFEVANG